MRRTYTAFAIAFLGLYAVATVRGWDLGSPRKDHIPESVRQAPGGYRSYAYWRGGK